MWEGVANERVANERVANGDRGEGYSNTGIKFKKTQIKNKIVKINKKYN
jgi:hypothetical protein